MRTLYLPANLREQPFRSAQELVDGHRCRAFRVLGPNLDITPLHGERDRKIRFGEAAYLIFTAR
ncbi:hypothetical protein [Microbacterium sp.]|uniref:hypothetical protein n=1 Tax=Microbacterium sp. TaxID=51671 RepID=UPI00262CB595|nr:hypothetical protein [Microbacterium sp.]MCV0336046.1 hypothetical protein [Microbacterium sp.]MCV0377125.1 hypothetical protein [Microbacterium sp.]MCV0390894.1 hypothetical protein [Microbacterium sp.]MCV0419731.1 hypothetical protein [Microbacterium sp.]MCV0422734.1 hypothetical protein [Microbacterium sp.]